MNTVQDNPENLKVNLNFAGGQEQWEKEGSQPTDFATEAISPRRSIPKSEAPAKSRRRANLRIGWHFFGMIPKKDREK
jgi:hypothetical protein